MDSSERNKLRREITKRFEENTENCAIEEFFKDNVPLGYTSYQLDNDASTSTDTDSEHSIQLQESQSTNVPLGYTSYQSDNDASTSKDTDSEHSIQLQESQHCATLIEGQNLKNEKQRKLANWAVVHKISHQAINDLLRILDDDQLPSDGRTLLQTPKKGNIIPMNNGEYYYFGVANNLKRFLKEEENILNVDILINIDGLQMFNNSKKTAWPILMSIENIKNNKPFPVAMWCGEGKPDVNLFLNDFVCEMNELMLLGICINNQQCSLNIIAFICDAPARSYLKLIKSHTGYYSCEKCIQKGYYLNTVTFQNLNSNLRTDENFRHRANIEHHIGISPLENLKINMVHDFPLEYMHLVCLGVTRRLLNIWMFGDLSHRLSAQQINLISKKINIIRQYAPSDFNRKLRTLDHIKYWKATEYRMFLLYYGPLALKNVLPTKYYYHFMQFSCAVRILCCKYRYRKYLHIANNLLNKFVIHFRKIYGGKHLVYNVHNLIHLTNECSRLGPLDNWSAFKFENYLGHIKKLIRNGNKPLKQIVNRLEEFHRSFREKNNKKIFSLFINNAKISHRFPNNIVTLNNGNIFKICKITRVKNIYSIHGYKFNMKKELYLKPICSYKLGIKMVSNLSLEQQVIQQSDIRNKVYAVYTKSKQYICFPMS